MVAFAFASCKPKDNPAAPTPSLADLIKGKTYRLKIPGGALNGAADESSKFSGFTIAFNGAGTAATFNCNCDATTGGSIVNAAVNYSASTNTITFTGTMPTGWPLSITNVNAGTTGATLSFNATVGIPGKSNNYTFNMVTP